MANEKLPQLPVLTAVTDADLFYVVDVSDTTDDPTGSSKQVTREVLLTNISYLEFNTTATTTHAEGRISWNNDIKSLEIDTENSEVQVQVGHEMVVRVNNQTGSILTKGTVVYINGEQGQRPTVTKADYSGDSSSASVIGLVAADIDNNNNGYVVTSGILEGLNTVAYSAGTPLYLFTGGTYSNNKPQAPDHDVRIGKVIVSNATTGSIYVNVQNGYELDELHDVRITSATTNDMLVRSSYNGIPVWVNTKTLSGLTYVESSTISATTVSATTVTVSGNSSSDLVKITQTGSGNAFVVEDSASPDTSMFVVDSSGNVGIGTNSPISKLQISNTATTVSSALLNTSDFVTLTAQDSAPGFNIVSAGDQAGYRGVFKATRSRGTLTTPLVPILNDDTLSLLGAIYDGVTNYSTAGITFEVDGTVTDSTAPQRIILSTGTGSTRTERMRINSEGNVGIGTGTLSPQSPLHVRANSVPSTNETILRLDVLDSPTAYFAINNGSTIDGVFVPEIIGRQASTTGLNAATIGGYIDPLQDSGTTVPVTVFRSAVAGGTTVSTRPLFDFRNWATSVMLMSSSGNVGIGTTSPSEKLHVSGNAIITGTTTSGTLSATTISGGTMVITSTPTTDNTNTQVLTRDSSTGVVELTDISSLQVSFNYGLANAIMTGNFLT